MGNLITKNQFRETELNNSGLNDTVDSLDVTKDVTIFQKPQEKDTTPNTRSKIKNNILNFFATQLDPRSPTPFISRTPLLWKNKISPVVRGSEFAELVNESIVGDVSLEILTREEEESLPSSQGEESGSSSSKQLEIDPRSPTFGIARTPILLEPQKKEEKLLKKITEKLVVAVLHDEPSNEEKTEEDKENAAVEEIVVQPETTTIAAPSIKKQQIIFEDLMDLKYSTPPKSKKPAKTQESRTPLSCLANKTPSTRSYPQLKSSTPIKSSKNANIFPDENTLSIELRKDSQNSRIPVINPRKIH